MNRRYTDIINELQNDVDTYRRLSHALIGVCGLAIMLTLAIIWKFAGDGRDHTLTPMTVECANDGEWSAAYYDVVSATPNADDSNPTVTMVDNKGKTIVHELLPAESCAMVIR